MADTPTRRGRPSAADREREILEQVFDRHSNGDPLGDICAELGLKQSEFRRMMRQAGPEIQTEWKAAKDEYVHSMFGQIHSMERRLEKGQFGKEDGAKVQALRAAIDALKHMTGRLNPNQYGEQKAGAQGVTVIINSSLPFDQPADAIDAEFKVVLPLPGSEEANGR